jgi:thiol:disulfide interchange protein DsbC
MLRDVPVAAAAAMCNSTVLERNVALGRKHNITGTPTLVFVDGSRVPGAVDAQQVEKLLAQARP